MDFSKEITIKTKGYCDVHDITPRVHESLGKSGIKDGLVCVSVVGSTASITTIEYEPHLKKDLNNLLEKIIPSDADYEHNKAWGDKNGFAHLRASLIGPSVAIPVSDGKLVLGTWQQIVLIDFDNRERERAIFIKILGG